MDIARNQTWVHISPYLQQIPRSLASERNRPQLEAMFFSRPKSYLYSFYTKLDMRMNQGSQPQLEDLLNWRIGFMI